MNPPNPPLAPYRYCAGSDYEEDVLRSWGVCYNNDSDVSQGKISSQYVEEAWKYIAYYTLNKNCRHCNTHAGVPDAKIILSSVSSYNLLLSPQIKGENAQDLRYGMEFAQDQDWFQPNNDPRVSNEPAWVSLYKNGDRDYTPIKGALIMVSMTLYYVYMIAILIAANVRARFPSIGRTIKVSLAAMTLKRRNGNQRVRMVMRQANALL